jgi:hypothetical protein
MNQKDKADKRGKTAHAVILGVIAERTSVSVQAIKRQTGLSNISTNKISIAAWSWPPQ